MMILEYIKLRNSKERCFVSENERLILETLKIICDGNWIIESVKEFIKILEEIKVKHILFNILYIDYILKN